VREDSRTAVLAALLGNGALATLKGAAALATGSAAMLAETFHSLADTGNQVLLFLGMRLARRPPDERHPFGHGKDIYFWAFVVSLMLFSLGGAFSIAEGVRHLLHPSPGRASLWAWGVLAGAFVFESSSLAVALRGLRRAKGNRSVGEYLREARDPTLPTVVLEDTAALVSIALAAVGIGLTQATGSRVWDAAASCLIGIVLIAVAGFLAVENYSLLLGETATPRVQAAIRRVVEADPAVESLVSLHTMHLGPENVLVALEVKFRDGLAGADVARAVTRLETAITQLPDVPTNPRLILIEPEAAPARGRAAAA
jgi:cation diffusion facilitator family transporter